MTATDQRFREFKMPDVGEGLTEAEILKWYVQPGDTVTDGQVVCEVETAKAAVELPIPFDGVVHELNFGEGVTVDVGTVIISVDTDPGAGPAAPAQAQQAPAPPAAEAAGAADEDAEPQGRQAVLVGYGAAPSSTKRRARKPQPGVPAQAEPVTAGLQAEMNGRAAPAPAAPAPAPAVPQAPAVPAGRPLAKPPVRKLAKDLGIDLTAVIPTGPEGIITREDVHAAAAPAPAPSVATPSATEAPAPDSRRHGRHRPMRPPVSGGCRSRVSVRRPRRRWWPVPSPRRTSRSSSPST